MFGCQLLKAATFNYIRGKYWQVLTSIDKYWQGDPNYCKKYWQGDLWLQVDSVQFSGQKHSWQVSQVHLITSCWFFRSLRFSGVLGAPHDLILVSSARTICFYLHPTQHLNIWSHCIVFAAGSTKGSPTIQRDPPQWPCSCLEATWCVILNDISRY